MTKTRAPLKVDQVIAFAPVDGVTVRLQRTAHAYAVHVERHFEVDELRHTYATEAQARAYARGLCTVLRAGWTAAEIVNFQHLTA